MFQLIAYKGAANGWAPIGRPRPFADACRLMKAANAVNGDVWSYGSAACLLSFPPLSDPSHDPPNRFDPWPMGPLLSGRTGDRSPRL
jgi:hypothetical protein